MNFIDELISRNYFYQSTDLERLRWIDQNRKIVAYVGFDCTAKSLHIGNLIQIMILRLLQQHNHKPIVVIGGATTKIGDPSGKDEVRKLITDDEIQQNLSGIKRSLEKFIQFGDGEYDAILINNQQWLESLNYISFLRDYGKLISVNRMLTMESVKSRLERNSPLTFLEFNYMLLQAYDFYYLHKNYGCNLQIGGSDQWGNIIMGVEIIKKLLGGKDREVFGLTTQLITNPDGKKMGKTVDGAVWLNAEMYSPYKYFQYWRNIADSDVVRFATLYGEFSNVEIGHLMQLTQEDVNAAKKQVAHKITMLCHGKEAADQALYTAIKVFEDGAFDDNLPTFTLTIRSKQDMMLVTELLIKTGLTNTKSEGKRLISSHAIKINNEKVTNSNASISMWQFVGQRLKISSGKKQHVLVKINSDCINQNTT